MKEELLQLWQEFRQIVDARNNGSYRQNRAELTAENFFFWLEHDYLDLD